MQNILTCLFVARWFWNTSSHAEMGTCNYVKAEIFSRSFYAGNKCGVARCDVSSRFVLWCERSETLVVG